MKKKERNNTYDDDDIIGANAQNVTYHIAYKHIIMIIITITIQAIAA